LTPVVKCVINLSMIAFILVWYFSD